MNLSSVARDWIGGLTICAQAIHTPATNLKDRDTSDVQMLCLEHAAGQQCNSQDERETGKENRTGKYFKYAYYKSSEREKTRLISDTLTPRPGTEYGTLCHCRLCQSRLGPVPATSG